MTYIDMCHIRTRRYTSLHHICHIQTCTVSEPVVTLVYIYMPYIDTVPYQKHVDTLVYIIYAIYRHVPYQKPQIHQFTLYMPIYRPVPYQNTQIHWFILLMPYIDMCHIRTHRYTSLHYICHIQTCDISELVDTPVYIIYAIYRPVPYQNPVYTLVYIIYAIYRHVPYQNPQIHPLLHYICHIQTCAISEPVDTLVYIIRAIYRHVPYQNPQIHQFTLYVAIYRHVPYQNPQLHQFTLYVPYIDMCHIRTRRYTSLHFICHIQTCAISETVDTLVYILYAIYRHVPYQNPQIHQFTLYVPYIDMCHIRTRGYTSFHFICHIQTCAISEHVDTLVYITYVIYRHVPYQSPQIHQFPLYMP